MPLIEQAKKTNTAEAWKNAYWTAEGKSREKTALCRQKAIECAERENTVEAWKNAYWTAECGSEQEEYCMKEMYSLEDY